MKSNLPQFVTVRMGGRKRRKSCCNPVRDPPEGRLPERITKKKSFKKEKRLVGERGEGCPKSGI